MTTAVVETPPATPPSVPPAGQAGDPPVPPATPAATTPPPSEPPAAPVPPTAPETYELTLPEGSTLDDSDRQQIAALAKSKGWTNEQAQSALNEYAANLKAQADTFKAELDAHPELGGTKYQQAQEHAMRVLDAYLPVNTPEGAAFRTAMNKSGYGNYAPLLLLLSRIGRAMAEDRPPGGGTAAPPAVERKTDAAILYPNTTPV